MMGLQRLASRAAANPLLRRVLRNSGYLSANGLATAGSIAGAQAARRSAPKVWELSAW
jgi:hypothetical protein